MVFMSDEFLSEGSVIRSRNQNGSCSSNGASVLPLKWKPSKVSVVRDFPRGCGSIIQPVDVDSQEANPSSSLINNNNQVNDTETMETRVKFLFHDMSKSTEDGKMGLIVEFHKILQKGDNQTMFTDEVDDNGGSVVKEYIRKMNFPKRRVFAVRDFPPYCGLNATEPTEEERLRINGKRIFEIEDKGGGKNARLTEPTVVVGKQESSGTYGSVKDEVPTGKSVEKR